MNRQWCGLGLILVLLSPVSAFGQQTDFVSRLVGRLDEALIAQSVPGLRALAAREAIVRGDVFDDVDRFGGTDRRNFGIQQYTLSDTGELVEAVFERRADLGGFGWLLLDLMPGERTPLGPDEVLAKVEAARHNRLRPYDGLRALAHERHFADLADELADPPVALRRALEARSLTSLAGRRLIPFDHTYYIITGITAALANGMEREYRLVAETLPAGQGRVSSGWYLTTFSETDRPAPATSPTPQTEATALARLNRENEQLRDERATLDEEASYYKRETARLRRENDAMREENRVLRRQETMTSAPPPVRNHCGVAGVAAAVVPGGSALCKGQWVRGGAWLASSLTAAGLFLHFQGQEQDARDQRDAPGLALWQRNRFRQRADAWAGRKDLMLGALIGIETLTLLDALVGLPRWPRPFGFGAHRTAVVTPRLQTGLHGGTPAVGLGLRVQL